MPKLSNFGSRPDLNRRLAVRNVPTAGHVMYQRWSDLLFLHWDFPAEQIQQTLPPGLFTDTFKGKAYLGIVPFFMENVRPRFCPALPGLSSFLELNLRTYVHDHDGVPGVWFYSLDANQRMAVEIAKRLFHLPYHYASMSAKRGPQGSVAFRSERQSQTDGPVICNFKYAPGPPLAAAAPDTLEFFLVERYLLYTSTPRGLMRGQVWHNPYTINLPHLSKWDANLMQLNGFTSPGRPPDHALMSPGVDVKVFPLNKV